MKPQRREFLRALAAGATALSLPRAAFTEAGPTSSKRSGPNLHETELSETKLTGTITLISGAGNNIVSVKGDSGSPLGSLLVDCGVAEHAQEVLKLTGSVAKVFNTHWHLESTGGNDAMAKAGAKLASHVNTQLWMTQEIVHDWEKKVFPPFQAGRLPVLDYYGVDNVSGDRFRRVTITDENRFGLLGKGAVLMVTAYPNRTSPVLRGAYILENLLGTPPSPPPPNV